MADDKAKGIDNLSKPSTGSNLTKYWKDFFPGREIKVFVYKGINQRLRGRNIFSKEDDISLIALEQVAEFEGIFGGEAYSNEPLTVTEDKSIKELELNNIPQISATAFLMDLKFNYKEHNLYFTIDEPFIERDVDEEYLDVYTATTVPGTFGRMINSLQIQNDPKIAEDAKEVTMSFNFTPAVLKNSLQSSKVSFISDAYIKDVSNKKDFEIESIDIEADHTTMFEFRNWIKIKGDLQFSTGQIEEVDIDLVADKPFLPLQIQPFAKNGNVQFLIANFNKYNNIPYIYAKKIRKDKVTTVSKYITQLNDPDTAENWIKELNQAVIGMFVLSWAFSTGFEEYRDTNGNIASATKIAGLSIEYLQSKGVTPLEAIDSVLEKFKYKHPDKIETPEFIRSRQLLCASSQWINSSYCIAKGNTEVHKMILDFYLDLNTLIDKTSTEIYLKLGSLKYDFKFIVPNNEETPHLKHGNSESNPWIEIIGRYISIPEMEDPISISDVRTFPGDFNSEGYDLLKTFVGVDVTESEPIKSLLINTQTSVKTTKTVTAVFNTGWIYIPEDDAHRIAVGIPPWENSYDIQKVLFSAEGYKAKTVSTNQFFKEVYDIYTNAFKPSEFLQPYYLVDNSETDLLSKYPQTVTAEQFKHLSISIPEGASNVQITEPGTKKEYLYLGVHTFARWEGVEYTYDISVEENSVDNERVFYDKGTFEKFILNYVREPMIKRKLTLSDKHKVLDSNGNVLYKPKWKSIQRIFLSFFLGNHVDIRINYSYTNNEGNKATGFVKIPRITLPSKHDELRTKLGIRLGLGSSR